MEDTITFIAALFLIFAPPIDWVVAWFLLKASQKVQPEGGGIALRERATVALLLAGATTINAVLAWVRLFRIHIDANLAVLMLCTSLVLVTLPNIVWAITYIRARRRFGRGKRDE